MLSGKMADWRIIMKKEETKIVDLLKIGNSILFLQFLQVSLQNIRCTGCKLCTWAFFIVALRSRLRHRIRIRIDPSQQFPADIAAVLVLKRLYKLLNSFIVILLLRCRFRVCIAFQSPTDQCHSADTAAYLPKSSETTAK